MYNLAKLDKATISINSNRLLQQLLKENKKLKEILLNSENVDEVKLKIKNWVFTIYGEKSNAIEFYRNKQKGREAYEKLSWPEVAAIRLLDYIDNSGNEYTDYNIRGGTITTRPVKILWVAAKYGIGGGAEDFFLDMIYLFRQFRGEIEAFMPTKQLNKDWMNRHPSGLDENIIKIRQENKDRILKIFINKFDEGVIKNPKYAFDEGLNFEEKYEQMEKWWNDYKFHLKFAFREPDILNEFLNFSLGSNRLDTMYEARNAGIPLFVNPYYASLLKTKIYEGIEGSDLPIRHYIFHSESLIEEFGHIVAWEKEDIIKEGEPNAAGWLLPNEVNVHRRYPEVAILIPETMGRACAGLCVSCQRMYDFQRGHLNFNLKKLRPKKDWKNTLKELLEYYEKDSQLRDILITGGDAFMSSDNSMRLILDEVYNMALRKKKNNKSLPDGKKLAEMLRVRLGTRILAYLPQRITPELISILKAFKKKAEKIGIKQFVIQTHFETAIEITPEAKTAIEQLNSAGWIVTNQMVFTAAASRRGHANKLRKVLNDVGVMPYYTFSVKGFKENSHNFATNARAVQEQLEEKSVGSIPKKYEEIIKHFPENGEKIVERINEIREKENIPFLATDRNVLNMPGVGKSLTFRVIGITRFGRRILEFEHDQTRNHSPVIKKMGKVTIVESKTIKKYLDQLEAMGEDISEYESIWGYSIGQTEERLSVYEYPEYDYKATKEYTNLQVD